MPENAKISELFGSGRLSYDELLIKAGEAGIEIGDVGEVKSQYGELLHGERVKSALERELDKSGAINRSLVTKVLDMSRVTSDEDGVYGLEEQIEALKESDPYLFKEAAEEKNTAVRFTSGAAHTNPAPDPDRMDDREYYKRIKKL